MADEQVVDVPRESREDGRRGWRSARNWYVSTLTYTQTFKC